MYSIGEKMKRKKCDFVFMAQRWLGRFLAALVVLLLIAPAGLFAERHGATLHIVLLDGRQLQGELLAVKGEVLLLLGQSGSEAQAAIGDVAEMRILRESRVGKGLVSGLVTGCVIGSLLALPATLSRSNEYSVLPLLVGGGMCAGIGAVIGAGAGLIASSDDMIRCRERDSVWRSALLKRLESLARFRDYKGSVAGGRPAMKAASATLLPWVPKDDFKRWHLGATVVQSPPAYIQASRAFNRSFHYNAPLLGGEGIQVRGYDEDGIKSWVRLHEISLDYSLSRRWTVGILFNPYSRKVYVLGNKTLYIVGKDTQISWDMEIENRIYFLTTSYSILAADGILRKTALRLSAGIGWNRFSFRYWESGYNQDPNVNNDPARFSYNANMIQWPSSSLSAQVGAEAAQYFNSRWSLALDAGFRYVPLNVREHEVVGVVYRQRPLSDLGCYWNIPAFNLNIGGLYCSVRLGFHF
jgi:hypothetical protein